MLYFGVWPGTKAGHFLYNEHGRTVYPYLAIPWPYHRLDATLCPGYINERERPYGRTRPAQNEGEAALHHLDGWTALAFWDRSEDTRGGCNSVFLAEGTLTGDEMIAMSRERFPRHWARFTFPVRVVA